MGISVKLKVFEGPLDLLLHLIDKNKIDIYDIPIAMITDQYMEYIAQMDKEDMNIMSEFLVMAATLLSIKSRMLLPKEEEEEDGEEDPRTELVQRLLEYKMYKYTSFELKDMQLAAEKAFFREEKLPKEIEEYKQPIDYDVLLGEASLSKLNEILAFVLKKQKDKVDPVRSTFGRIEREDVDMEAKQNYIQDYIIQYERCSFRQLLEKQHSKMEVIVTFMLILEMMKTGKILISQENLFEDITIISNI